MPEVNRTLVIVGAFELSHLVNTKDMNPDKVPPEDWALYYDALLRDEALSAQKATLAVMVGYEATVLLLSGIFPDGVERQEPGMQMQRLSPAQISLSPTGMPSKGEASIATIAAFPHDLAIVGEAGVYMRPSVQRKDNLVPLDVPLGDLRTILETHANIPVIVDRDVPDGGSLVIGRKLGFYSNSMPEESQALVQKAYPSRALVGLPTAQDLLLQDMMADGSDMQELIALMGIDPQVLEDLVNETIKEFAIGFGIVPDMGDIDYGDDGGLWRRREDLYNIPDEEFREFLFELDSGFVTELEKAVQLGYITDRVQSDPEFKRIITASLEAVFARDRVWGHIDQLIGAPIDLGEKQLVPISSVYLEKLREYGHLDEIPPDVVFLPIEREIFEFADILNYPYSHQAGTVFVGPFMAQVINMFLHAGPEAAREYQNRFINGARRWGESNLQVPRGASKRGLHNYLAYNLYQYLLSHTSRLDTKELQNQLQGMGAQLQVSSKDMPTVDNGGVKCRTIVF